MADELLAETKGEVLWLTMNRPEALNAMNASLVEALRSTFESLKSRTDVRIVVLQARGKTFCAGLDLQSSGWGGRRFRSGVADYAAQHFRYLSSHAPLPATDYSSGAGRRLRRRV